jgi:hypothetical protein
MKSYARVHDDKHERLEALRLSKLFRSPPSQVNLLDMIIDEGLKVLEAEFSGCQEENEGENNDQS